MKKHEKLFSPIKKRESIIYVHAKEKQMKGLKKNLSEVDFSKKKVDKYVKEEKKGSGK